ncbi:MAG: rhomboid family intramembrane serine protease [Devosia sp.]|jgi:membrane associated rhomboid family serine protease|uniref:rhomboid family intramembrane serine protease n=1 Tax=Devosia sp. TaxID=1871048 RepID=UPI001A089983|nr:rhomboid family intramembrane serine protease [Devosia sp.]MBF0679104.1 rhomboid family intramembrane serine protease [Devosia sp.]
MFLPLHDFNPHRHVDFPYVTYGLIAVTVLVYLVQAMLPPSAFDQATINFGMIPIVVRDLYPQPVAWLPDWANLVTYAFLHADWLHLLTNMLFLWVFGDNIEDALGHFRFLIFYFACAILAALAHLLFNLDGNGPLIGASGAVAGVMGAYILLFPHVRVFVLAKIVWMIPLPVPAFLMLGFWVASQLFYALFASGEPVAWWAHVGGFVAGVALAPLLRRRGVKLFGGR